MNQELNIILKPHEMDVSQEIAIRKAGHYERVENHQIHRFGSDCLDEAIYYFASTARAG